MEELIHSHKIIVCTGTGGVGKTTVSSVLALKAASLGKRVLVLTIDPAKRLSSALGISGEALTEIQLPDSISGKMYAKMINAEKEFINFVKKSYKDEESSRRLMRNRLFQQLSTSLSGAQEFTALSCLVDASSAGFDLVVLDTPPSQNIIDFLRSPKFLLGLFQKSVISWFVAGPEKTGLFKRVLQKGTQTLLETLERITGALFMKELSDFFNSIDQIHEKIAGCSTEADFILKSKSTAFITVSSFDCFKIEESKRFKDLLSREGYSFKGFIINRVFPFLDQGNESDNALEKMYSSFQNYHAERKAALDKLLASDSEVYSLPEINHDIVGVSDLLDLSKRFF